MKVEQLYTGCLAEAAYYIESNGEAAIIDPLRETAPYLARLQRDGAKLKYIFETHFHADFVSGHLDLAKATGATIVYGPNANPSYEVHVAADGEVLQLGNVSIKVLHTPGHTMESSSFLLRNEQGKDYGIFTGDTLFIGDVGRPDLAVKTDLSREDLAAHLFDSLRNKVMLLADDVIVYPGHGAGSACGKNLSEETIDTLGHQKATNYALRPDMTKEEFVKELTDGLFPPPQYFPKNAVINKVGYEQSYEEVMKKGLTPRSATEVLALQQEGAVLIDTRSAADFAKGFIPNSLSIGLDGMFAVWVGTLIEDLNTPIIILTDEGDEKEIVTRLSRVGYDNPIGYLQGGVDAWKVAGFELESINSITASEFAQRIEGSKENLQIVDVRRPSEYLSEHVVDAENIPVDLLKQQLDKVPAGEVYLYCKGGYRSMIAASLLKVAGFRSIVNVEGGFKAISETSAPVTDYVCPSTL